MVVKSPKEGLITKTWQVFGLVKQRIQGWICRGVSQSEFLFKGKVKVHSQEVESWQPNGILLFNVYAYRCT
jgi:hypothetical protein